MNSGKIFVSILAGAAAGALAGILLAPAKGTKTRRRILKKGEDYVGSVKEKMDEMFDTFTEKFDKVKEEVIDYAEEVKEGVSGYAEAKMSKAEEAKKYVK